MSSTKTDPPKTEAPKKTTGSASITKTVTKVPVKGKASIDDKFGDMMAAKENLKRMERNSIKAEKLAQKKKEQLQVQLEKEVYLKEKEEQNKLKEGFVTPPLVE
jgi:hypothetical protein